MLVINKKRIKIILGGILISLFAFSFQIASENQNSNVNQNIIQTTATPVSGKTVVLDAGHRKAR